MSEVLRTENLAIGYGDPPLLSNLNLSLERGKATAMIGRNGVGKSTLIKTLTNIMKSLSGQIFIGSKPLVKISKKDFAREVAVVTTDPNIAGGLRVLELVGLGRIPYTGKIGILGKKDKERVEEAIRTVGLEGKGNDFVGELSDGERQKAMIARGLVQDTPIIIMDEPFSYLDVASRLEMLDMIKTLARTENKAILFSTHEVGQALKMADEAWMFVNRKGTDMIETGTPEELIANGAVNRLFPGKGVIFNSEIGEFEIDKNIDKK